MYPDLLHRRETRETALHVGRHGLDREIIPMSKCARRVLTRSKIIGAILQCTSYSVPQIMVARYITGIGTGIETSTVPMYQSELCDAKRRGRLVSSEPLFVGVGIVSGLTGARRKYVANVYRLLRITSTME
jgi:MFS family permease